MTNREFYLAVSTSNVTDEIKAFALESIAKLDNRNAKRSSKPSKATLANEPIRKAIVEFLIDNPKSMSVDIANAVNISTSKMTSLGTVMVKDGTLTKDKIKVKGKGDMTIWSIA